MIHYNTTNLSFVKMHYLLKSMGIKRNTFFLELKNKALINVDPYDPTLSDLHKAMIIKEMIENPWYFFREIVKIASGGDVVPFELHRGTLALIWSVLMNISVFVVWPRQTYKTTTMAAIYTYLFYWGSQHFRGALIAHEDSIVKKNLEGIKEIRQNLPPWMNPYDSKKDRDNERMMFNRKADNKLICKAPSMSEDGARKAGRGLTTQGQWFDEISFIKNIGLMYDSVAFAYSKASESARKNGSPYHQVMTTTAGFLNTNEGKWAYNFRNSCADFSENLYDMDYEDIEIYIKNSSTSNFLNLEFMYYDLGKNEEYLEDQKRLLVNSPTPEDTLDREVLNKWKDVSTSHPLGQERVAALERLIRNPVKHIMINDVYMMRIYKDLDNFDVNKPLVGGMDLGGNLKGDFSTLVITDPVDFSVVAVMRTNSQSTTLFSLAIATIMNDLFPGMILFPERNYNNSIIDNIIMFVTKGVKRVYHEAPNKPGLFNSKKVRPMLFNDVLRVAIDEYGYGISDKTIIAEMKGLIRARNGRIDHRPGEHDDTLIAYLLSLYFLIHVKDIDRYLDVSIILSQSNKLISTESNNSSFHVTGKTNSIIGGVYMEANKTKHHFSNFDELAGYVQDQNKKDNILGVDTKLESIEGLDDISEFEDGDDTRIVKAKAEEVREKAEEIKLVDNSSQSTQREMNINRNDFYHILGW